jgi:Tol biopolymer transport system component
MLVGSGSWSPSGVILFGTRGVGPGVHRVSAAGGPATLVTRVDPARQESFHAFPSFLADGRHFTYSRQSAAPDNSGIFIGSLDLPPEQQPLKRILPTPFNAAYVRMPDGSGGRLLFLRDATLMAQALDTDRLELTGEPVPVAEQVGLANNVFGFFSGSAGVLVYRSGGGGRGLQLTWFDRQGKATGTVGDPGLLQYPVISPDGRTVAVDRVDQQTGSYDIWLHDLARGTASRFTFNSRNNEYPVWSPDGSRILFASDRAGALDVFQKPSSGATPDAPLLDRPARIGRGVNVPEDWSSDGKYIFARVFDPATKSDIWVIPQFGDRHPFPYLHSEFSERMARLSPNGQWLAYSSDENRQDEVFVQSFPTPGGKWQISTGGGAVPIWSRDGRELYFISVDRKLMAVDVKPTSGPNARFEASVPKVLFQTSINAGFRSYAVARDGRFLIPAPLEQSVNAPYTVVVNWAAALGK